MPLRKYARLRGDRGVSTGSGKQLEGARRSVGVSQAALRLNLRHCRGPAAARRTDEATMRSLHLSFNAGCGRVNCEPRGQGVGARVRLKYCTLYFQITGVATVGATRGGRDAERSAAPPRVLIKTHYNVQNVHVCGFFFKLLAAVTLERCCCVQ